MNRIAHRNTISSLLVLGSLPIFQTTFAQSTTVLPTIVVQAQVDDNVGYYADIKDSNKLKTSNLDTAQNIQVVNQQLLKDKNAQKINDVVALVSGVNTLNPMSGLWDNFSVRGFNTDQVLGTYMLRNGIPALLGLNATRDMVNIDSLAFLKGADAAFYGAGDPGGSLNIITKKPQFEAQHSLTMRAGSYDQYRIALDSSNAITDAIAYRLGLAYQDNHSFRDYVTNDHLFVAPQLLWHISDRTQLHYDSEYSINHSLFDRGVLAVNQKLGTIPNSRFLGEKADGPMHMNDYLQQLNLSHQWNQDWQSKATINFKDNSWRGYSSEAYQLLNSDGDLNRERRYRKNDSRSYLFNHDLTGWFSTGALQHQLLFGSQLSHLSIQNELYRYRKKDVLDSAINIYQPQYGVNLPALSLVSNNEEVQKNAALSLADNMRITPKLSLLLGGRWDYFEQHISEYIAHRDYQQSFNKFSPKAALNYRVNDQWSLYSSFGKGFHLNAGLDIHGQAFDPERSTSYELGAKTELFNRRLNATLSLFDIRKKNVLTSNPVDSAYSISAGEEKSRGIEVDLSAQPMDELNIKMAYAYTDAKVSQSSANSGIAVGSRLLNSPKHLFNLSAMYDIWQSDQQKLSVGGNIQYVSARSGNLYDDGFELAAYHLLNLTSRYQINSQLDVALDINNVFNKKYYSASLKDEWVTPGNPREAFLTVNYHFN